jgi:Raf kinase inhibitor-like YbhB/YbcL family protein
MDKGTAILLAAAVIAITLACTVVFAAEAPGSLLVTSKPDNASVLLDTKEMGFTPLTITGVLPGKHTIAVKKDGYKPFQKSVTVKANKTTTVSAVLQKATPTRTPTKKPGLTPTKTAAKTPAVTKTMTPTPLKTPVVTPTTSAAAKLTLISSAFAAGGTIPDQYGCRGSGSVIPVSWQGVPAGTKSFVLILDDPDAPGGTFTHWSLYNIPPSVTSVTSSLVSGAISGSNSGGGSGYYPPCPPSGVHRYIYHLYALDSTIAPSGPDASSIRNAMNGHTLATATLQGTYSA